MEITRRIGAAVVALGALSLGLSGCGSMVARDLVHRHDDRLVPMGGTALDAIVLTAPLNPMFWPEIAKEPASLLLWPVALADFPLSATFDAVTLPVALVQTLASFVEGVPAPPPPSPKPAPRPTVQHDDSTVGVNWLSTPAAVPSEAVAAVESSGTSWRVVGWVYAREKTAPRATPRAGLYACPGFAPIAFRSEEGLVPVACEQVTLTLTAEPGRGQLCSRSVASSRPEPDGARCYQLELHGQHDGPLSSVHARIECEGRVAIEGDVPVRGSFVAVLDEAR
jgi:hypothetical protein